MVRYSEEQRAFIVQQYFENNEGLAATVRNFRTKYGRNSDLTSSTVKRLIEKFRKTGSVSDLKHTGRPPTSRSIKNIEAVRESVAESPGTSIRHRGRELNISRSSLQRILAKDLNLTEITKEAGELWRELNDKSKWEEMTAKEGLRCAEEMQEYKASSGTSKTGNGHKRRKGVKRKKELLMKKVVNGSSGSFKSKEDDNFSSDKLSCTGASKTGSGNKERKRVKRKHETSTKKAVNISLNSKNISNVNSSSDGSASVKKKAKPDRKGKSTSEVEDNGALSEGSEDDEKATKNKADEAMCSEEEKSKSQPETSKGKQISDSEEDDVESSGDVDGKEEDGKEASEEGNSKSKSKSKKHESEEEEYNEDETDIAEEASS